MSPEVKKQQSYKYYNNTYMYVTFREEFLTKPGTISIGDDKKSPRDLYQDVVLPYLKNAQQAEGKLKGVDLSKITFKQAFE